MLAKIKNKKNNHAFVLLNAQARPGQIMLGVREAANGKTSFSQSELNKCPVHQVTQSMFHLLDNSKPPNTKQR